MMIQENLEKYDEPDDFTVQFYSKHTKLLKKTQVSKALKFIEHDCIRYIGTDTEFDKKYSFVCLPLNTSAEHEVNGIKYTKIPYKYDYNTSEYKISKRDDGTFECNCQGWQSKFNKGEFVEDGCMCSHVLALLYAFKLKKFR